MILVFTSSSHNIRDMMAKSQTLNFHGHCFDKILIGGLGAGQADSQLVNPRCSLGRWNGTELSAKVCSMVTVLLGPSKLHVVLDEL